MKIKMLVSAGLMLASAVATAENLFGVTGGYNLSTRFDNLEYESGSGYFEYKCKSGFNAGLAYEHRFTSSEKGNLFLDAQLLYSLEGYRLKAEFSSDDIVLSGSVSASSDASLNATGEIVKIDEYINWRYIKVPVGFGYNFKLGEKFGLAPKVAAIFKCELRDHMGNGAPFANFAFGGGAKLNIGERISVDLGYDWMPESFGGDHKCVLGTAHANFTYYFIAK